MVDKSNRFKLWASAHKGTLAFAAFAVLLFIYYICCLPGNNIFNWMRAKREIRRQNKEIEYYNSKIEQIDSRISSLSSNKDSLERFAREEYQYAEPGDDVYLLK